MGFDVFSDVNPLLRSRRLPDSEWLSRALKAQARVRKPYYFCTTKTQIQKKVQFIPRPLVLWMQDSSFFPKGFDAPDLAPFYYTFINYGLSRSIS